jgi:cytochrome c oxidase assembly protein subunit 15
VGATPALGFGMAVSMWAVAYLCRLPAVMAPAWLLLVGMLAMVLLWGWLAGRWTGGGWSAGLRAGLVAAVLDMLILGSLLADPATPGAVPPALVWLPGTLLVVGGLAAVAAAAGSRRAAPLEPGAWPGLLAMVAVAATFLLVVAGGLVTSHEAGLAVVDWPNTFGYNMFLYPLTRMTGGIYYEHAHRLFGSLVGLATIGLALVLWRARAEAVVQRLALVAVVLVVLQGLLGGLRVTGSLTLSTDPGDMAPSIALAVAHGVLGQVFLALMVGLAVASAPSFRRTVPVGDPHVAADGSAVDPAADRRLHLLLLGTLLVQLVLGAFQRHLAQGLLVHVVMAAAVTTLAIIAGIRAWTLYEHRPVLPLLGKALLGVVSVQVALGIAALAVTQGRAVVGAPTLAEVTLATAHQACGALLLAVAVVLMLWTRRALAGAVTGHAREAPGPGPILEAGNGVEAR